jgi:hypothetical protein
MITTMILVYLLSALAYTEHQTTKTLTCRYRRVQPNQSDRYDETIFPFENKYLYTVVVLFFF